MPETAIAEPPVVEKPTPPAAHPGAVTIDLGNLGKKAQKAEPAAEVKPPVSETTEAEKTPETKTPEIPPVDPTKKGDKEENMANLRKAREAAESARKAAEEERDRLKTEMETLRTKTPEIPEDVKTKLTAAEKLEQEVQEMRQRLRQTDLARDPEFQEKYNKPITARIGIMGDVAIASGVPVEEWKSAVGNWNEEQFAEWRESMTPVQRVKFDAAWTAAVDLYQQQQEELKNADRSYQELEKQRRTQAEEQQKQYLSQNEQLAKTVLSEVLKPDSIKEYEGLTEQAEAIVMKAARHEIPAKDIFQNLAANQILARVTQKQATEITDLKAKLEEREKKIKEQDEFIQQHAGAVPRGDAAGSTTPTDTNVPLWKQIQVKMP
jgi:HAMP domain-containing protein